MRRMLLAAAVLAAGLAGTAPAWWVIGHASITEAAAAGLPDEMPAFFRNAGKALGHCAGDPDRWKNRETPFLNKAEAPNHFLDIEDLDGNPLPRDRFRGIALISKLNKEPDKVGLLPYALMEGFEKLAVSFQDYRNDNANPAAPMKCIVHGGTMAHYSTDAAMPLHTTRNYDGRPDANGKMTQRGIHAKLDGYPEKNKFSPEEICRGLTAKAIEGDVWDHIHKFIKESHTHIDKCYEFDAQGAFDNPTDESRAFVMARCKAGAQFTMDLWYTAWLKSAKLPAPY